MTSADFTHNIVFTEFVEEGDLDADYRRGGGPLYDVSGAVRVWRNLAVGVAVSAFTKDNDASVTARIPHPFFFDRDRQIGGAQGNLNRQETAVHVQGIWVVPVNEALEIAVFGGPTFFDIEQDLVTEVRFTQAYPFDTATYTGTTFGRQSRSKVGFNVGADVTFYFSGHIGVGVLARFSRATIDLPSQDGGTVAVEAGGLHTGGRPAPPLLTSPRHQSPSARVFPVTSRRPRSRGRRRTASCGRGRGQPSAAGLRGSAPPSPRMRAPRWWSRETVG